MSEESEEVIPEYYDEEKPKKDEVDEEKEKLETNIF